MPGKKSQPTHSTAVARRLKDAAKDPSFRPADLLGDGKDLLSKAKDIKGFLSGQRHRTDGHTAKTEWTVALQQLQDEQTAAEKELAGSLRSLLASTDADLVSFASDMLSELQQQSYVHKALHAEMVQQAQAVVDMKHSVAMHGGLTPDTEAMVQELRIFAAHNQQNCQAVSQQLEDITREVNALWPSALPCPHSTPTTHHTRPILSLSPSPSLSRSDTHTPAQPSTSENPWSLPAIPEQPSERCSEDGGVPGPAWALGDDDMCEMSGYSDVYAQWSQPAAGSAAAAAAARDAQQLDQMIGCYPLADDTAKARVRMVFAALRHRHQQKLDAWHGEAWRAGGGGAGDAAGGWPEAEHSLFVSLRMKCWRERAGSGVKAVSRDALMRQLAVLMPSRTLFELIAHDDWLTAYKILQRKRRGLLDAWAKEKSQFIEDSAALLEESQQVQTAKAQAAADKLAHELEREAVHATLDTLREVARQEAEVAARERAAREAADAERQAAAAAQAQEEAARTKALIAAYRTELQRQAEAEARASAARQVDLDAERQARAEYNRDRVDWRHAEYLVKQDKRRDAAIAAEHAAAAREERLARLRALVAPDVACDPMRVLLPTEASSAVDDEKVAGAFRAVHGYTVDQVYKDKRMRVFEALNAAGLAHTQYARNMVIAAQPATLTRADNLTTDQKLSR